MRTTAVFAQPVVDQTGRKLLQKWYDAGTRLFILWASIKNTSGANPAIDRQAQLEWRAAVKALGADARYIDYPLADWRQTSTKADLDLMANDSACAGIYFPDEPNLSALNPATGKWDVWRNPVPVLQNYIAPVLAHGGFAGKLLVVNLAGPALTAAWGSYKANDVGDLLAKIPQITHVLSDWHPRNNNPARYGDDLPGKAVRVCGWWTPLLKQKRGAICECANEQLSGSVAGRSPTPAEIWAQYQGVVAEDATTSPVEIMAYFPQAPKPNASHIFDNTTNDTFDMVKKVFADFAPIAPLPAPPDPVAQIKLDLAAAQAQITTLQSQIQQNYSDIQTLKNRKYTVVEVPQ